MYLSENIFREEQLFLGQLLDAPCLLLPHTLHIINIDVFSASWLHYISLKNEHLVNRWPALL